MAASMKNVRPYPHEYFVTVRGRSSGEALTTPFADEVTALDYMGTMEEDPHFELESPRSFPWHVTFYVTSADREVSAKFNMAEGAAQFADAVEHHADLVLIEYNFIHSV
jgi:hypothetical protein